MATLVGFVYLALMVWVACGIGQRITFSKISTLAAFGLKEQVFVNNSGICLYHKTRNFLPTFPKLVSEFPSLNRASLTVAEACSMLPQSEKERYESFWNGI